jgi:hypothetical protein
VPRWHTLQSPGYRATAKAVADEIRGEDGAARVIEARDRLSA